MIIYGMEQSWLTQCPFKVTGWGIMLTKYFSVLAQRNRVEFRPAGTADLTTTVPHSYKSLINYVKPVHSLKFL